MNLLLAAAIATVTASEPMSFERMSAMEKQFPALCDSVQELVPTGGNYAKTLLLYSGAETSTEKMFVLVVCQNYIKGKMAR
jgi:hypothetical protein